MDRWIGRVALVTGASSGIGAAIAEILARSGLKVVGAARGVEHVQALSDSLKGSNGSLTPIKCDLTKEDDIRNMFATIKKHFGGVDICINNAGLSNGKKLLDSTVEELHQMSNVNIIALCLCSQLAIASMRERGIDDGHVININSTVGHSLGFTSSRFYAATKVAVKAITEGLRQEMREAKSHIRITSVSPGLVSTQFAYRALKDENKAKQLYSSIETLKPEDVASSVVHVIISPPHVENIKQLPYKLNVINGHTYFEGKYCSRKYEVNQIDYDGFGVGK
ncbi:Dehydrogenase/reductase SDR family member 11 [Armadillidium nasatum]|uniref:Dehydrogenase/reductase SDR family member 11 n=1 Tax=Armadillidium nasatum TaxID=96803 RepID=A0A5N5SWT5_9CRUS|nr:Dehydrogenase/reductase SDR family member 11 [Armadillidium nasatum]